MAVDREALMKETRKLSDSFKADPLREYLVKNLLEQYGATRMSLIPDDEDLQNFAAIFALLAKLFQKQDEAARLI